MKLKNEIKISEGEWLSSTIPIGKTWSGDMDAIQSLKDSFIFERAEGHDWLCIDRQAFPAYQPGNAILDGKGLLRQGKHGFRFL